MMCGSIRDGNEKRARWIKALFSFQKNSYNTRHIEFFGHMHGALNSVEK